MRAIEATAHLAKHFETLATILRMTLEALDDITPEQVQEIEITAYVIIPGEWFVHIIHPDHWQWVNVTRCRDGRWLASAYDYLTLEDVEVAQ